MSGAEDTDVLNYILTGGGSALVVQIVNAVINRKNRQADGAKQIVSGSLEWADRVDKDNERLRIALERVEAKLDRMTQGLRVHNRWDELAAARIRDIDPSFPDPPSLEVA